MIVPMIVFGQEIYSEKEVNIKGDDMFVEPFGGVPLTATFKKNNQPVSGIVRIFWKSERLKDEIIFKNGQLESITRYWNSKKGNRMHETIYKNGSIYSSKSWSPSGRLLRNE